MSAEGTSAPVQSPSDQDASRLVQEAPSFPASPPVHVVHQGGDLFGGPEESRPYQPQRNSAVAFLPRPTSEIPASPSSIEKQDMDSPNDSTQELYRNNNSQGHSTEGRVFSQRRRTRDSRKSAVLFEPAKAATLAERLQPTIDHAISERDKYALKAKWTGWVLNIAIGLQVLLGSLTTGLSAVATTGNSAAKNTTILGALSTLVASYLARARGSNEPELSIARTKDLDQFIRECDSFKLDHGHDTTGQFDDELIGKRRRFEELLGNASGERKLAPPV